MNFVDKDGTTKVYIPVHPDSGDCQMIYILIISLLIEKLLYLLGRLSFLFLNSSVS